MDRHKRGGLCQSTACESCNARRTELSKDWNATEWRAVKLPPAKSSDHAPNFIGLDGLPRYATPEQRREVYDRDKGICQYCRRRVTFQACNIDHLIPWPKGKTIRSNLITACRGCNKLKGRYNADDES